MGTIEMITHLNRVIVLSLLWVVASISTASADWIDDFIAQQLNERRIPGLSIAVLRDGEVLKAAGYGMANLELQVPATKETVYEIGSISKQFAAEAVMLLVEEGKLDLDKSIVEYLPSNAPESWEPISVRNLLNQTSGLKDWTEVKEFSYRREYTSEEFIDLVSAFPLEFQPNDDWKYSNTNLPLVGIIVERVSEKSYEAFVTERIFAPLDYPSIQFNHNGKIVSGRASGYVLREDRLEQGEPFRPQIIAPSGGVLANAVDLARWWEAILKGRLLKATSLEQMLGPTILNNGKSVSHGFAFFIDTFNGHKMIFHHGSTVGGFGSVVRYFPNEKLTIAVIGNLEDGGFGPEYISKRIANVYSPGSYIGGLTRSEDSESSQLERVHLELLREIAENKPSSMLTAEYAPRITPEFRETTASNLKSLLTFEFLGREKIGDYHFMLDRSLTEVRYFKLTTGSRTYYYHFRCLDDGKFGAIFSEE